jgi:hypothetical protein
MDYFLGMLIGFFVFNLFTNNAGFAILEGIFGGEGK